MLTYRPPLELLLGPAGAGKTDAVLRRLCDNPGKALLVVTSSAQASWLARRAAAIAGPAADETARRIVPLSALTSEILRHEREGTRAAIGRNFQRMVLGTLVPAVLSRTDFMGKMLDAPGFVSAFQERLREWKVTRVTPSVFEAAAEHAETESRPQLARKLRDIQRLFAAYEQFLTDNGLRDDEDCLVRAAELLEAGRAPVPWDATQIIVHGFYRFTGAQVDLLRACAVHRKHFDSRRVQIAVARHAVSSANDVGHIRADVELAVTLPWEARRPLDAMCADAWRWQSANPHGFNI